jgi:hypothetical protein
VARTSARLTKIGETLDRIGGTPTPTAAAKPAAVEEESDGPEYPRIRMLKGRKIAKTLERARMNALLENSKLAEVRTARAQRIAELDGEIAHLEGLIDGASR